MTKPTQREFSPFAFYREYDVGDPKNKNQISTAYSTNGGTGNVYKIFPENPQIKILLARRSRGKWIIIKLVVKVHHKGVEWIQMSLNSVLNI